MLAIFHSKKITCHQTLSTDAHFIKYCDRFGAEYFEYGQNDLHHFENWKNNILTGMLHSFL